MLSLRGGCSNIRVQTSNASKPCSIFSVKPAPASCWFTSQPATVNSYYVYTLFCVVLKIHKNTFVVFTAYVQTVC